MFFSRSLRQDEFPEVLKWRRKPSLPAVSSSLPDLLGSSAPSLAADTPFSTHTLTGRPAHLSISGTIPPELQTRRCLTCLMRVSVCADSSLETEKILLTEPVPELGQMEYQLLKLFILL